MQQQTYTQVTYSIGGFNNGKTGSNCNTPAEFLTSFLVFQSSKGRSMSDLSNKEKTRIKTQIVNIYKRRQQGPDKRVSSTYWDTVNKKNVTNVLFLI